MNKKIIEKSVELSKQKILRLFSDKPYSFYKKWEKKFEYDYKLLNFPKDMFLNKTLGLVAELEKIQFFLAGVQKSHM